MCGIAGTISLEDRATALDLAMIRHRGPDSDGEWRSPDGHVWFGHTRLAILDLSPGGAQPMLDEATGNVIVFNGEIYNHLALRKELQQIAELRFQGTSDTETLLKGFGIWGRDILPRLEGMFAFAIYVAQSRSVFLARDRFGIKPLYLKKGNPSDGIQFCSEVRPLIANACPSLTKETLAAYLHCGACPHETLLFPEIEELPAGSWSRIHAAADGVIATRPVVFWPSSKTSRSSGSIASAALSSANRPMVVRKVRQLLEDSVQKHLLSDVPVACFLSGGIDSSILVALASRLSPDHKPSTFSVGFAESGFDESVFAKLISQRYETDHHHIQLGEDEKLSLATEAIGAMDLPSYDAINTYIVSKKVAETGLKVAISGLGADEIFGGYPIFRDYWRVRAIASIPAPVRDLLKLSGRGLHLLTDIPFQKNGETLSRWWRRSWHGSLLESVGLSSPPNDPTPSPLVADAMGELTWGEVSHYMRDVLLRDSDAMSMAHSLEIRVPFLDNQLVDYLISLPAGVKFEPSRPKSLLLDATEDLIPREIWDRPKMGFSLPMEHWMKGPLKNYVREGLDLTVEEQLFERDALEKVVKMFEAGNCHWSLLWQVVILGHYLKNRGYSAPESKPAPGNPMDASSPPVSAVPLLVRTLRKSRGRTDRDQKFLIPVSAGLGDFLMATPFYENLRREFGDRCIDFLVSTEWPAEEFIRAFPITGSCVRMDRSLFSRRSLLAAVTSNQKNHLAAFLPFDGSPGSAYLTGLFLKCSYLTGKYPYLIGHSYDCLGYPSGWTQAILSHRIPLRLGVSTSDLYFDLAGPIFSPDRTIPRQAPPCDVTVQIQTWGLSPGKYVVLQPGAANGLKSPRIWPSDHIRTLAGRLADSGFEVVLLGSANEAKSAKRISRNSPIKNLLGKTSLLETTEILRNAAAVASHDSGLVHLADCLGTPFVVIFGPSDLKRNAPIAKSGTILRDDSLPCIGCRSNFAKTDEQVLLACQRELACMTGIGPERVFEELKKWLPGLRS